TYIKWDGCTIKYGGRLIRAYHENDNWSITNSTLWYGAAGFYGIAGDPDVNYDGPDNLTITGCDFRYLGTKDFPDIDGHAVGSQACNGYLIDNNYCYDTGAALVLWTVTLNMKN